MHFSAGHSDRCLGTRFNLTWNERNGKRVQIEFLQRPSVRCLQGHTYGIFNFVAYIKHQHIKDKGTDGAAQCGGNGASLASFPNQPEQFLPPYVISISKLEYLKLLLNHNLSWAPNLGVHLIP